MSPLQPRDATSTARATLLCSLARATSFAFFLCRMFDHLLCPAIVRQVWIMLFLCCQLYSTNRNDDTDWRGGGHDTNNGRILWTARRDDMVADIILSTVPLDIRIGLLLSTRMGDDAYAGTKIFPAPIHLTRREEYRPSTSIVLLLKWQAFN